MFDSHHPGLTKAEAARTHDQGKFIHVLPSKGIIQPSRRDQFQLLKTPRWFKAMMKNENPRNPGCTIGDHPGKLKGTETYAAQPYALTTYQLVAFMALEKKYALRLRITGFSSWFPGRTFLVTLDPTDVTYKILKIRKPKAKDNPDHPGAAAA